MQLHYREYGTPNGQPPPVVMLHGLLGSSGNWQLIAKRLVEEGHYCLVPDLRNHGRSPHDEAMDYPLMAGDLLRLLDDQEWDSATLVGHSMGAKVAMWMALSYPQRVAQLVSADMVPGLSHNRFSPIFDAMLSLNLSTLQSRQQADDWLATSLDNPLLRQYLLQNLVREEETWRWRVNLRVLDSCLNKLLDFPEVEPGRQFQGETLFLYGGESDYVTDTAAPRIRELFPYHRLRAIPGAGHWVYSDQPEVFASALLNFLS